MRLARFLLAGLLLVPAASLGGEIVPVKGEPIKGDIVSVSATEVVYEAGGEKKKLPVKGVLRIEYREVGRPAIDAKFAVIDLADGTTLYAKSYLIKKRTVEIELLSGPKVKVPLETVSGILNEGDKESTRRAWRTRAVNSRGRDVLVVDNKGTVSGIECTFGDGSADGTEISYAVVIGVEVVNGKRKLPTAAGFLFKHVLDPKAPVAQCQLFDTIGNVVIVSGIKPVEGGLEVATPSGATLQFKNEELARIDYTKGKLDYLADLTPTKTEFRSNLDEGKADQTHVYLNQNLGRDGVKGKIQLGGVTYDKGLTLKPFVEVTYGLRGDYSELSMLAGIDDQIKADGAVVLEIRAGDKLIETVKIASTDKIRFKPVTLNIKDVQTLTITVKSGGDAPVLFDTGRHMTLADAKVSK
ncbi:MAG: NPCBM/NEW2 domain-containing protein [Gemmataceae bacterium]|nr:NPCBM/NEW2 domain-containing protein [Gemmataceae bacterium]